ncbi:MAG: hypothetical protein ACJA16_000055 [Akkermansiaceae bacterium]|jgi:hypothetical protein
MSLLFMDLEILKGAWDQCGLDSRMHPLSEIFEVAGSFSDRRLSLCNADLKSGPETVLSQRFLRLLG